jgi:hypothetical protein
MNVFTASTWINQPGMFLFFAQIMGGGANEEMHEVPYNLQAAERSFTTDPIFRKPVMIFIATRDLYSMKMISGFRGLLSGGRNA